MSQLIKKVLEELAWRTSVAPDVIREVEAGDEAALVESLIAQGLPAAEVLAATCQASGIPLAPQRLIAQPEPSGGPPGRRPHR
jgi:hypothetical protein